MLTPFQTPTALSFQRPSGGGDAGPAESPSDRKLRIAFIVPEDRKTGTYFRYHNLAVGLCQIGHKVTIYSQSSENRLRDSREIRDGVLYVLSATVPGNRWMLSPTNPGTLLRRLFTRVEPADVYHLFQPFPTAALIWLWLQKWRKGLFVYDWDDFWINEDFGLKNPQGFRTRWAAWWIQKLEKKLPSLCHLATTVSHPLAELARDWNCSRSTVIYNGVWPQGQRDKQKARDALNLKPDAFYAGLMGWSGELEWCLEGLRQNVKKFPNLRLAITGRDPAEKLAAYPDIRSRVDYLGALPDRQFSYFNQSLDLGLVPMRATEFNHYRLPFKLTDHLAGGVPVLCSRIGDASRLADELEGIVTCEPDLNSWLREFNQTIARLSSTTNRGTVPTEPLLKRFSWLKISREMASEYCAALAARPIPQTQLRR